MALTTSQSEAGLPQLVGELKGMVLGYLRQETLDPLKGLARFAGFGVAGAVLSAGGFALLLLAVLRVLQNDTGSTFHGNLSPLPYLATGATGVLVAGLAVSAIRSGASGRRKTR